MDRMNKVQKLRSENIYSNGIFQRYALDLLKLSMLKLSGMGTCRAAGKVRF